MKPRRDDPSADPVEQYAEAMDKADVGLDPIRTTPVQHPIPISDPGEAWRRKDGRASVRPVEPAP